jgi:hypothetical protein
MFLLLRVGGTVILFLIYDAQKRSSSSYIETQSLKKTYFAVPDRIDFYLDLARAVRGIAAVHGRVLVSYSLHRNCYPDRLNDPKGQEYREASNRSIIEKMRDEYKRSGDYRLTWERCGWMILYL